MSTETRSAVRTGRRRYAVFVAGITAVLVVLAGALTAVAAITPPRISSTAVSPETLISRPGGRLVLTMNQAVAPVAAEQVRIVPEAPFEIIGEGATLTVRFSAMLDYATEYTVAITGVRGAATGATGDLTTAFTTPGASLLTKVPGDRTATPAVSDRLLRSSATGIEPPVQVYAAARIDDFVAVGDAFVVISDEGDGAAVRIVRADGSVHVMAGPSGARYRMLRAAPDGRSFGYLASGGQPDRDGRVLESALYVADPLVAEITEVRARDDAELHVMSWDYVPLTDRIIVKDYEEQVLLLGPRGGEPVPLGRLGTLLGFVPGTTLLASDAYPDIRLDDLASGSTSTVPYAGLDIAESDIAGVSRILDEDSRLQVVQHYDQTRFPPWQGSTLIRADGEEQRELYRPAAADSVILAICLAPNARLVAIEVGAAAGAGRPTTFIIDAETGAAVRSVPGGSASWCR